MSDFNSASFKIINIYDVYFVDSTRQKYISTHLNRPNHGLVYKISGSCVYHFADCDIRSAPGMIVYLPEGSSYTVTTVESGTCIAINFNVYEETTVKPFCETFRNQHKLKALFTKLYDIYRTRLNDFDYRLISLIYEILAEVETATRYSYVSAAMEARVKRAVSRLEHGVGNQSLSIEEVAEGCGISVSGLRNAFNQIYGISPVRYLTLLRINAAKLLLAETDMSIEKVSAATGFGDQFYFSKVFKKHCGVSPSEYRRLLDN